MLHVIVTHSSVHVTTFKFKFSKTIPFMYTFQSKFIIYTNNKRVEFDMPIILLRCAQISMASV